MNGDVDLKYALENEVRINMTISIWDW
jgi:hypothetical protein